MDERGDVLGLVRPDVVIPTGPPKIISSKLSNLLDRVIPYLDVED